ncbi:RING finger protein, putative [Talaromyces stipitatus ATCC 10500]|uniref:RING finger protein, putative n=1 Tax=Talaromyces stipitatus (strain ATCC 10500 / CBS 375.48 / QM 6759 / NRRL 1006) TaxID=441959 RepID=B8MBP0_TALSN|nr:RING finger protein, putative [Talaromyces stipitatus ATCC 10500]EED18173.1 RING finger protein, putative [Talaromyces stipitatus ATCC 10500]
MSAEPIASRQPSALSRTPSRLSQDSLHQLEQNASEPVAASRASRVRSWIQELSINTAATGSLNAMSYQNDHYLQAQGATPQTGQVGGRSNAAFQGLQGIPRTIMRTAFPLPGPHLPVIDLTEPSTKRLKVSDHNHPSSQSRDTKPQPSFNSTAPQSVPRAQLSNRNISTSRESQPSQFSQSAAAATVAANKPSKSVTAKQFSPQKDTVIDLTGQEAKTPEKKDVFKSKIKDFFPDICEDYIQTLYTKHDIENCSGQTFLLSVQNALDEVLAKSSYPKKQASKKRKEIDETIDNENLQRIRGDKIYYYPVACKLLQRHFTSVPEKTVKNLLAQHKTFLKTYIALHYYGWPESDASEYWKRLHNAKENHPSLFAAILEHELREAKRVIAEKEGAEKKKAEEEWEKAIEEEHRLAGTLAECQCCFTEVLPDHTVPCNGDKIHLFCNSCIKQHAETQVGLMQYELKCFDTSGCHAGFDRNLIKKIVGDKLMKRLEHLQQQDEIAKASIDGLEECPFCEFKAICPPVEEDKEFACLNSECEIVSCRLCKQETHIPKTCEEAKKERGLEERHAVEEAMTAALIRKCTRCGLAIIKEDGCNKLTCRCGALICDVCKKDISVEGYNHFHRGTCNLHERDTGVRRRTYEVMQAEKAAVAKVVAQDGKINPEMLRVTTGSQEDLNPENQVLPMDDGPQDPIPLDILQVPQMPPGEEYVMPAIDPVARMHRIAQLQQRAQFLQAHLGPPHQLPQVPRVPEYFWMGEQFYGRPNPAMRPPQAVPQTQTRPASSPRVATDQRQNNPLTTTQPQTTATAAELRPAQLRQGYLMGQATEAMPTRAQQREYQREVQRRILQQNNNTQALQERDRQQREVLRQRRRSDDR